MGEVSQRVRKRDLERASLQRLPHSLVGLPLGIQARMRVAPLSSHFQSEEGWAHSLAIRLAPAPGPLRLPTYNPRTGHVFSISVAETNDGSVSYSVGSGGS